VASPERERNLRSRSGLVRWSFPVLNQQDVELAELAGGFIHEIKNHLSTLGLNLQLLAEDFEDPRDQRERRAHDRVLRLQSECQRLVDVANDFLRFARVKDLVFTHTDLRSVLEELIDFFGPMARAHNIEIKSYISGDLPPVGLDREMFKQALLNLMLNAQQARTGADGKVPDSAAGQGGELTVQAAPEPGGISLSLIDTGRGMPPDVVEKAFKPFYSTRKGGTGLGLPTVRKIVEAHGGRIELQSEVGRGTKFTIHLPAALPVPTVPLLPPEKT
jgi:two-component system sensor histidine kinase HydH